MATLKQAWEAFQQINGAGESLGNFAAGPESTFALGRAIQNTVRGQCRGYANSAGWIKALDPSTYLVYDSMCKGIAQNDGTDLPTVRSTHTGGQCEGVEYTITYETRSRVSTPFVCGEWSAWTTSNTVLGGDQRIFGPVSNIQNRVTAVNPPQFGEDQRIQYTFSTAGGTRFLNLGGVAGRTFFSGCGVSREYRNPVFTRVDGLPDSCGDPEPELLAGTRVPPFFDVPPEYRVPPGPRADPFGDLPLLPFVDPEFGPVDVEPSPVGGAPAGGPSGARPGSGDSIGDGIDGSGGGGGTGPEGGEDVPFPDAPEGRVWVGALVEVDGPQAYGNIPGSGPENRAYPRTIGNCSLTFDGGRGRAYRIESQWTDLIRPSDGLQVTGVRVNVLPGVSFRVYPVSDETCPDSTCGDS